MTVFLATQPPARDSIHSLFPAARVSPPAPLAAAIRLLLAGGALLAADPRPARAELPVPASVLVAPGAGSVLPPTVNGNTMTIRQVSDKATLDWKSFNIGAGNAVKFEQPSVTSVALNNIHQHDPSRIQGTLTANGQVYLVNQNGFVFGKNAQINVNSLVASTLNISEQTFQLGITRAFAKNNQPALSATDAQGQPIKELYLKDAGGQPVLDQNGQKIKVQIFVDAGARISTNAPNGRVILAAPSITNKGRIEAPDGQVILAASQDKVYLQQADADSGIRGFLVEVGTGGDVNNIGKIIAERGNASLIGFAVNQKGLVSATTSVKLNGSVRLLAREGFQVGADGALLPGSTRRTEPREDGLGLRAKVNLERGSLTSVELDANKAATAVDAQTQDRSRIEIQGHGIYARTKATVRARSGIVDLTATDDPADPGAKGDARIYLDAGSRIDVSGVKNVVLPMSRNVVKVELRNNELRDSPLQRDGVLHGKTVAVDIRDADSTGHIPIADISGALDRIARNIDERSTSGGTLTLNSSGDLIARPGSVLDVSGGSVAYRSGLIETTQLVSGNRLFDIGQADSNRHYDSLLGDIVKLHPKWGIAERWARAGVGLRRFEPGYVEGKPGGSLNLSAYNAMLDGLLQGRTVNGKAQREPDARTPGAALSIDLNKGNLLGRQDVVFAGKSAPVPIGPDDPFPETAAASGASVSPALTLSAAALRKSGFGKIGVQTNGKLSIQNGVRLALPDNGVLDLAAGGFDIQGSVKAPGGAVSLKPVGTNVDGKFFPQASGIVLGKHAEISVRGEWVNDMADPAGAGPANPQPVAIDGGSVSLVAEQGNLTLEPGSHIDASGGAWLRGDAQLTAGKGGSIQLTAQTQVLGKPSSNLILGGKLEAWGIQRGGSLGLASGEVSIGAAPATSKPEGSDILPLVLAPDFFRRGGFADYSIGANLNGLAVADGARIHPLQRNLALPENATTLHSADRLPASSQTVTLPDYARNPANLSLYVAQSAEQNRSGVLSIGKGAEIKLDREGEAKLGSATSVRVDGAIVAPAGKISIDLAKPPAGDHGFYAAQAIWLGADSRLSARGAFAPEPSDSGLVTGEVLPGGGVALNARRGYIVTEEHSLIDVSGAAAVLQFRDRADAVRVSERTIPSDGGTITLAAAEGIVADGSFAAKAGGAGASGGTLRIELNGSSRSKPTDFIPGGIFPDDRNPNLPREITVSAGAAPVLPGGLAFGGDLPTKIFNGRAFVSVDKIGAGGFGTIGLRTDALNLNNAYVGAIRFRGDVQLAAGRQITLDAPTLAWSASTAQDAGTVSLVAPHVALGSTQSRVDDLSGSTLLGSTLAPDPVSGPARFSVSSRGIDLVGGLSFDGFGKASLNSQGDLRAIGIRQATETKNYVGELRLDGDLSILADQFYPATLTDYTIDLGGRQGTLAIQGTGAARAPVYSAGGSLTLNAPNIVQAGVLVAPFGQLNLNAGNLLQLSSGSLTSVSGAGLAVPFGRGSGGLNWLYPMDTGGLINRVFETPPEKRVSLSGLGIRLQPNATVDISGGGDLRAYEFITGPGGSKDTLDSGDPSFTAKFAVIPGIRGISTPYDPLEFPGSGLKMGDSVYLGGGSGLPAGNYTLLPAHYALLPGAYLVTPRAGTRDLAPGYSYRELDDATVVAGRYRVAGTDIQDARWRGFAVEPGSMARTRSEFHDYSANGFFANKALTEETAVPQLPMDAGGLAIAAGKALSLGADVYAAAAPGGRGGSVDISADRLAIVGRRSDSATAAAGTVSLLADDLNRLGVESLLLGGLRSQDIRGRRLAVTADSVSIAGDADLSGREIILAAKNDVRLASGAVVESTGSIGGAAQNLLVSNRAADGTQGNSDGALLRVSSLNQIDVVRDRAVTGDTGLLTVESGARLKSDGSILLDSTRDTRFDGGFAMHGGSLSLKSSKINLGDAPAGAAGLILSGTQLNRLSLDDLRLFSATDINLYGGLSISAKTLSMDAADINGFGASGTLASLTADTLKWSNTAASPDSAANGAGTLALNARIIELGGGQYAMNGFGQIGLNAGEALMGKAGTAGRLTVGGELALNAGHFSGGDGSTLAIEATGHAVSLGAPALAANAKDTTGLGAGWSIAADAIAGTGRFDLPSGTLSLKAGLGDLRLGSGTAIDVSGQAETIGGLTRYSPAGSIFLVATKGNVTLDSGASLNLAGATLSAVAQDQTSDAGSLSVQAPLGAFNWNGRIAAGASSGSRQGRFSLDAATLGAEGFPVLNGKLAAAGFTEEVAIRQRTGDASLPAGQTVRAHRFELALDQGSMAIAGRIDAAGDSGGTVAIQASKGIALQAGAAIDAHARDAGAKGGGVTLDTVASGPAANGSGLLDLAAAASIDVSGGAGGEGGSVHLRTGRDDATGRVNATAINAAIVGSSRAVLEATRVYNDVVGIDANAIAAYQADTAAFMAKAQAPLDHSGARVLLAPGLDIRNQGDISLDSPWDFMAATTAADTGAKSFSWRYQGVPGYLSLNAGGDLKINAALTDAFATAALPDPLGIVLPFLPSDILRFQDVIQPGDSWSYTLKAGGDVLLANSYRAPDPLAPSASIPTQVVVRTGTGDIDIKAGGDIRFLADPNHPSAAAAVYTMGRPAGYGWGDLLLGNIPGVRKPQAGENLADYLRSLDPASLAGLLRWGYYNEYQVAWSFLAEYPTHGGNVGLSAGGDIFGIQTGQLVSDWMVRAGTWNGDPSDTTRTPTAWGINVSGGTANEAVEGTDQDGNPIVVNVKGGRFFNQNVGALGGGDVSVRAGGDVSDLSVMIPTTGKPFGILTAPDNNGKPNLGPNAGIDARWLENGTVVQGGGNLAVRAGGDIRGGEFYTGRGAGLLEAGGGIHAAGSGLAPIVELGDAQFDLRSRTDLALGTALNPTLMPQHVVPDFSSGRTADFVTYGRDSAVNLVSTGGDIVLQGGLDAWKDIKGYTLAEEAEFNLALYPGTLRATAMKGDIRIDGSIKLFPSATGQLELLAGHAIGTDAIGNNTLAVNMSDADPAAFPSLQFPVTQLVGDAPDTIFTDQLLDAGNPDSTVIHATTPVHAGDPTRVEIVAGGGDIAVPKGGRITFFLPKAANIEAGRDIRNISVYAQNLSSGDITRIRAGRDIRFDTNLDNNGNVNSLDQRIQQAGPGRLQVVAGRDINLGSSSGLLSIGNLSNRALPKSGAAIDVLAGLSDKVDYSGFLKKYLKAKGPYLNSPLLLEAIGDDTFKKLPPNQRLAYIEQLGDQAKLAVAQKILFNEIKLSAAAAAAVPETQRKALYQRGFEALRSLFPGKNYAGDLGLVFSQIKSYSGGDITIATPGGQVDVGLAGRVGGIQKSADQLGIVVQGRGDLNAYTQGDFNVNQSRVFTMGGGDIAIWSSQGSIDAGKGAKSAISAPPPTTSVDEKGNIVTVFPPIVSGSGIQAIIPSDPTLGHGQGNVYLAAPAGVVNAGEAGIGGGRVVIAASAVIGASNIQASGGTVGVPTAVAPPVIPAGVSGAAAGAAKAATQSGGLDDAGKARDDESGDKKKTMGSILNTDVVGYGHCSVADVRGGAAGCGGG